MAKAPARRRLPAAARRESILAAAIPEFATRGYERTRVADVAARVGVTEPVVFQLFGTKAGLFAAVLEAVSEEVVGYVELVGAEARSAEELVSALLGHEHREHAHVSGGHHLLFAEAAHNAEPAIVEAGGRAHAHTVRALARLLRQHQAEGTLRSDVDPAAAGWLILSLVHARQFRDAQGTTSPVLERALREAVVAALRPPAAASRRR